MKREIYMTARQIIIELWKVYGVTDLQTVDEKNRKIAPMLEYPEVRLILTEEERYAILTVEGPISVGGGDPMRCLAQFTGGGTTYNPTTEEHDIVQMSAEIKGLLSAAKPFAWRIASMYLKFTTQAGELARKDPNILKVF